MAFMIAPFVVEHLDPAADLLATRHRSNRTRQPDLPPQYEQPAATRGVLHNLVAVEGMGGVVALRKGNSPGFCWGHPGC